MLPVALSIAVAALPNPEAWLPSDPGAPNALASGTRVTLSNGALSAVWDLKAQRLELADLWSKARLSLPMAAFELVGADGRRIHPADLQPIGKPEVARLIGNPRASCFADRLPGVTITQAFEEPASGLSVRWRAQLRRGDNYVRERLDLTPTTSDVDLKDVSLIDVAGATPVGQTLGSPATMGPWFFGFEHPMAVTTREGADVRISMPRLLPLRKGQTTTYSAVVGLSPRSQLRRGFLRYVERERAHPYRTFLHYNSWYDLGEFGRYNADQCVERIETYAKELTTKRGAKLDSFLFDDGWDDTHSVWDFHSGFPDGFTPLTKAAKAAGAAPGVWLSPWGGYATPRQERLAAGKPLGYEIDSQGFALSGPKYYQRFRDVTLEFEKRYGVNHFKFDGTGSPDKQYPGSAFGSDFEAAIALIGDLRKAEPDVFINLTTGTWPSPFWTRFADSTWRGGSDHSFAGVGTNRQRWITYRDGDLYRGVVMKGPLYPINSLMLHGIIFAQYADRLKDDPGDDFRSEVRSYFGEGTQLQELYITPSLLSAKNWDELAASAKWSRQNADVLKDTHWVGGDPNRLEVYGFASWSPRKAILTLRNPSDHDQAFSIDPVGVFELPPSSKEALVLVDAYDASPGPTLKPGESKVVVLKPFEVKVWETR